MCHCTVLRLNNLPHTIIFGGPNKKVPAKQRKDGLLRTVLKQRQSASNKALTLNYFTGIIYFVTLSYCFGQVVLSSLITMAHKN